MGTFYSIDDILGVAAVHPFYNAASHYPPSVDEIDQIRRFKARELDIGTRWLSWPLLHKDELYKTIHRLCADENPDNGYRRNSYISITGGGSGKGLPMLFLTDRDENYNQRVSMGSLMKACNMVEPSDWVLNLHYSGNFYRSLDLSTETIELAGGNVLCGGHLIPHERSVDACIQYRVNFLASDTASLLNFAHHVESLSSSTRSQLRISKIMYTSETMSRRKQDYLTSVFGPMTFFSCFASAETGPWAVANLGWATGSDGDNGEDARNFVFDSRTMKVEVLSLSVDPLSVSSPGERDWAQEGTAGHLILTCLQRLRNPLVRYVSGDVGSVQSVPPRVMSQFPPDMAEHLKMLRLYGRDKRFSFKWLGDYYEFDKMDKVMQSKEWGLLQWQVILADDSQMRGSDCLELRLLRRAEGEGILSDQELRQRLRDTFFLTTLTEKLFKAVFLHDLNGFQRSESSGKIVRLIDKRGKN